MANEQPTDDTPDADSVLQEIERKRDLEGAAVVAVAAVGIAFSIFQMWLAARGSVLSVTLPVVGEFVLARLQLLQINAIHVAFALVLAFLLYPASTGDGPFARRCVALAAGLEDRLGADHPVTRAVRSIGGFLAWAVVDEDLNHISPIDVVFAGLSALAAAYFVTDFSEIRTMRRFGLEAGRPVQEVFTFLEPVSVLFGPLADTSYAFVLGVVGVLLVLEATRRAISLWLMVIVGMFVVYARFGYLIPLNAQYVGVLSIPPFDWASIVQNLWYNTENGVFGIPVTVSVQFIYIFILFGAFLEMSGAGQWFIDLAYAATGTRKGGPAKASILASGFMGTISGSSIANTVTTGAFTIPLMKRSGYRPEFAGAVEASASSGGQILPPVMGAAAFLIVQYTQTPFADVIVAATIPAIVFFFGVWVMVHFEASKEGIGGLDASELVDIRSHLVAGWFYLVPIGLLLYFLIIERLSVARSAWFTLVAIGALMALIAAYGDETRWLLAALLALLLGGTFLSEWLVGGSLVAAATGGGTGAMSPDAALAAMLGDVGWLAIAAGVLTMAIHPQADASRLNFDEAVDDAADITAAELGRPSLTENGLFNYGVFTLKSMEDGARTAVPVVVAVAAAGIIPGVISISGLGPNLVALIRSVAGGSIVVVLAITAVSSIILGMGMPTTVTYIILSVLLAPVLTPFGIPELAAHLYILYFGVIADITPPVAVAAYAASGIAKSDAFQTGVEAFSLSLNKAIVPFAFVVTPGIVLLRRNEGDLPVGDQYSVVGIPDLLDVWYSVPEILLPVVGVFLGVIALAATVIGFVYTDVGRTERAVYALSALLLMAPSIAVSAVYDVLGLLGVPAGETSIALDLLLRGVGLVVFAALLARNRRASRSTAPATEPAESA
ncbi:TRAP transporter permease [Halobacterium rubrum]|uniref:TRAP transporter permease n=1 Tax=Halobacterium TaxID=2239 RepID=UPI001F428F40|nr:MULTISPECIES: TRAP transporter permease [Halobacterium]MDH5020704.1 TRAP transporter permease [Halobacterium rubrum]